MPKKEATLFSNLILKMPSLHSAVCSWSHRQTLVSLEEEYTKARTERGRGQGGHLGAGYHTDFLSPALFSRENPCSEGAAVRGRHREHIRELEFELRVSPVGNAAPARLPRAAQRIKGLGGRLRVL